MKVVTERASLEDDSGAGLSSTDGRYDLLEDEGRNQETERDQQERDEAGRAESGRYPLLKALSDQNQLLPERQLELDRRASLECDLAALSSVILTRRRTMR